MDENTVDDGDTVGEGYCRLSRSLDQRAERRTRNHSGREKGGGMKREGGGLREMREMREGVSECK